MQGLVGEFCGFSKTRVRGSPGEDSDEFCRPSHACFG